MSTFCHHTSWTVGLAALVVGSLTGGVFAQNTIVLKNDKLPDNLVGFNGNVVIVGAWNFNEEALVYLTSPCDGNIVEIQILWYSAGAAGQTVEQELGLYEPGACNGALLSRSATALQQPGFGDVVLGGPVLTAGAAGTGNVISFQHVDENQTIPLEVPVSAGQTFVIALTFGTDWCNDFCSPTCLGPPPCPTFTGATLVHDGMGCTPCRNGAVGFDLCALGSTGNMVMRAIVECTSGDGACCLPNGTCSVMSEAQCDANNGVFSGIATTCQSPNCTPPSGACCFVDDCIGTSLAQCNSFGGTWLGPDENCFTGDPCGLTTSGACCLSDNSCVEVSQPDCLNMNGDFLGNGFACDFAECDPVGACCIDGQCFPVQFTQGDCAAAGGSWKGAGSDCVATPAICIPVGACCFATGFCTNNTTQANCEAIATNTWLGEGTVCDAGSTCPDDCPADCGDTNNQVDVSDLLSLLAGWGGPGACDIAGGNGIIDVGDLLDLLAAWGGCP
jgi:hypothetical protein